MTLQSLEGEGEQAPNYREDTACSPSALASQGSCSPVLTRQLKDLSTLPSLLRGYQTNMDWKKEEGDPYPYYVYGAACSEVEVDCLTGAHKVE